jgi:gliding motility-associated-like protein
MHLSQIGVAQTCSSNFLKVYGGNGSDEGLDVAYTRDSGSIVAGRTNTGSTNMNGLLMKLNDQGSIQWSKSYGRTFYDELSKVKQTSDGGYVAVGRTTESGSSQGNAWIVRTDASGNSLWSGELSSSAGPTRAKDIIQLTDGGFVLALNANDSTAQSDAVLVRIDANGNIIWSRSYDNGHGDGFYSIAQDGNYLIAGGYSVDNIRVGIASKVDLSDGSVVWTKTFSRYRNLSNEIVRVQVTANGYKLGLVVKRSGTQNSPAYNDAELFVLSVQDDVVTYYERRFSIEPASSWMAGNVNLKFIGDSAFVYAISDTTAGRSSVFRKIVTGGFTTGYSHQPGGFHSSYSLDGLDPFDHGLMLAGSVKDFDFGFRSKIQVIKTDWDGSYGNCEGVTHGLFSDTIKNLSILPVTWKSTTSSIISVSSFGAGDLPVAFTVTVRCQKQYCIPVDVSNDSGCYATVLTEYWDKYELVPNQSLKIADGYILCGFNRKTNQPMVIKLGFNGSLVWSKTLNSSHHDGWFHFARLIDDGSILLAGGGGFIVGNGANTISIFMRMTPTGNVIWSKYISGTIADIHPTGDGTFTILQYPDDASWGTLAKFKLDTAGNFFYKKRLNTPYEIIPSFRRMAVDRENMYMVAAGSQSIVISKVDSSGRRVWLHRFSIENKDFEVDRISTYGDSVYAMLRMVTPVSPTYRYNYVLVKIGKNGNGINGVKINQDFAMELNQIWFGNNYLALRTTMTGDGNFMIADRIPGAPDSLLALIKVSSTGSVIWSKKFPGLKRHITTSVQDDGAGLSITGYRAFNDNSYDARFLRPFFIHTDDVGDVQPTANTTCSAVPFTITVSQVNLTPLTGYLPNTPNFEFLTSPDVSYQTTERILQTIQSFACGIKADCSMMKLTGSVSACNNGDTLVYNAQRNPGCLVPISWRFDTSMVEVITVNETSRAIRFKRSGHTKVYASILTPCGNFVDSLEVDVMPSAYQVDLGADTTVCPGNTVLLNAHKGYASYQWQDGSTDSTYIVTQPGRYHVTITDACGQTKSDTIEVGAHPPILFDAGPDRTKCNQDTLQFSAPTGFLNYTWSPAYNISSTTQQTTVVNPLVNTVYYVKAEKTPGCFAYDTIRVRVNHSPRIDLGLDQSFCSGDSVTLDAGAGFSSYLWNGVSGMQFKTVYTTGSYSVIGVSPEDCKSYDTVKVTDLWSLPVVTLDKKPDLCFGTTRTLTAGTYASYLWQDGSSSSTFAVSDTGQYWVQVRDVHNCVGSDTMNLTTILPLPKSFLPDDTAICSYGTLQLKPQKQYTSYAWSNNRSSSYITIDKPGDYWLKVVDKDGCEGRDSIRVNPKECMTGVYVPTAFSPNRDGKNDQFKAMVFGNSKKFELTIYNRWGQIIFYTTDPTKGWDGRVAGTEQETGVFVWMCRYQLNGENENVQRGTLTLIR